LVVKLPTMGGLASHCHERLTNTKGGEGSGREWRKMERKGKKSSK